jgi:hypothetical protein
MPFHLFPKAASSLSFLLSRACSRVSGFLLSVLQNSCPLVTLRARGNWICELRRRHFCLLRVSKECRLKGNALSVLGLFFRHLFCCVLCMCMCLCVLLCSIPSDLLKPFNYRHVRLYVWLCVGFCVFLFRLYSTTLMHKTCDISLGLWTSSWFCLLCLLFFSLVGHLGFGFLSLPFGISSVLFCV